MWILDLILMISFRYEFYLIEIMWEHDVWNIPPELLAYLDLSNVKKLHARPMKNARRMER